MLGKTKPDGTPYLNTENWTWLVGKAGKAARWLGCILSEAITRWLEDRSEVMGRTG